MVIGYASSCVISRLVTTKRCACCCDFDTHTIDVNTFDARNFDAEAFGGQSNFCGWCI